MSQFRRNGSRVLEVDVENDSVRALAGSMVAYEGNVEFKKVSFGGEGLKGAFKRKLTGESLDLMEMRGHGRIYLAFEAMEVEIVELQGETMQVESASLLAVDDHLQTNVTFTGLRGASSGQGLFTTTISGQGRAVLLCDGPAIALEVSPQFPLVVDPDAYVASKGQLNQTFVTDVSWRAVIGETGGESYSLRFEGNGVVYIQPAER